MHLAYLLASAFFYEVCIDIQLSSVPLKFISFGVDIRFFLGFKVNKFISVAFALNEVNLAFNDVFRLYQTNIDFGSLNIIPVSIVAFYIVKDLLQGDSLLRFGEVGFL